MKNFKREKNLIALKYKNTKRLKNKAKKEHKIQVKPYPFFSYSIDHGFEFGLPVTILGLWRRDPYTFKIFFEFYMSTKWKFDPKLFIDIPHLGGSDFRLTINFLIPQIKKMEPYFGIGNDTHYDSDNDGFSDIIEDSFFYSNPCDQSDQPKISKFYTGYKYYNYNRRIRPEGKIYIQKILYIWQGKFKKQTKYYNKLSLIWGSSFLAQKTSRFHNEIFNNSTAVKQEQSLLFSDTNLPINIIIPEEDTWSFKFSLNGGIVLDTRDEEVQTSKGGLTKLIVDINPYVYYKNSEYGRFVRVAFSDQRYYTLFPVLKKYNLLLVYAQKVNIELIIGENIPYYQLGYMGTSPLFEKGLGGGDTIRGFFIQRYIDQNKIIMNFEIRFRAPYFIPFWGEKLAPGFLIFLDAGRVWGGIKDNRWVDSWKNFLSNSQCSSETRILGFHGSIGFGLIFAWGEKLVFTINFGFSLKDDGGFRFYLMDHYLF